MSFTINFYFHLHEHNNTTIITSPINIDEIIKKVGSEEFIFLVITVIKISKDLPSLIKVCPV